MNSKPQRKSLKHKSLVLKQKVDPTKKSFHTGTQSHFSKETIKGLQNLGRVLEKIYQRLKREGIDLREDKRWVQ